MKCCQRHWDMLRSAVESRGLMHLTAKDSKTALENVVTELQGGDVPYDPLMSCWWMITNKALQLGGLYLMSGDLCPICEAVHHLADLPIEEGGPPAGEAWVENEWVNGPADAALQHCREQGLTITVQ